MIEFKNKPYTNFIVVKLLTCCKDASYNLTEINHKTLINYITILKYVNWLKDLNYLAENKKDDKSRFFIITAKGKKYLEELNQIQ